MAAQFSKADPRRRFKWLCWGLGLLVLPLLLALGSWQWQRADHKRLWLQQLEQSPATTPDGALERLQHSDWVPVSFEIELLPSNVFLLDNRTWQGRVGYEVIVPIRVDEGALWLGSLGWIAAPAQREQLPTFELRRQWLPVEGVLSRPLVSVTLATTQIEAGWPRRIQSLDLEQIGQTLAVPVEPLVLHLKTAISDAIRPREQIYTGIVPERHVGYAVQWFGLALALSVWLIWIARREYRGEANER